MQINNHTELFSETLSVIEKHAPNTHEAMLNSYWPLTGVSEPADLYSLTRRVPRQEMRNLVNILLQSGAVTVESSVSTCTNKNHYHPKPNAALDHSTFFNMPALVRDSAQHDFDLAKSLATTAIHEWTHRRGYGEDEAYPAGVRFAEKIGEPELAEFHRGLYRQYQREEARKQRELAMARRWGLAA